MRTALSGHCIRYVTIPEGSSDAEDRGWRISQYARFGYWLFLLVLSAALYLGTAGSPALDDDDVDAAHAMVSREMLQRNDFVVPYMDGIRYLIRPPMHFWMVAASYKLLGQSEFATPLRTALSGHCIRYVTIPEGSSDAEDRGWRISQYARFGSGCSCSCFPRPFISALRGVCVDDDQLRCSVRYELAKNAAAQ